MPEKTFDTVNRQARDLYQKAQGSIERNNLDYAIELFQEVLRLEPNFTKARKILRAAQMKRAESQGSFKRAMAAAKVQPTLMKGRAVLGKNPAEAMVIAESALCEDPRNGQALQLLAEAAEAACYPETAAQTLDHHTQVNPRDTRALHSLGRIYCSLNQYDLARDVYNRLVQIDPSDFVAQKALKDSTAKGAMQTGGWEEAKSYRDIIKDKEEAVSLEQQSRVVRAEDMIENLIQETLAKHKAEPGNPVHQRELGKLYGQKGDYERALQYLEKLLAAEAGADPTLEKEISEIRQKQLSDKVAAKKEQLEAQPANAALTEELAVLERQLAALQLKDTLHLVERYPNDLLYRYDLGVLYVKTGNVQEAIEQFQRSIGQPQRRVSSLNYLGQCFQQLGLHDLAIDQYAKAIEELPLMDAQKKEITYNLGTAYEALGDIEKAVAEFKKIAAVDFGYRDIRNRITRRPPPQA